MARVKDALFINSEKRDRSLATVLGITYDELLQLDHTVETDTVPDGPDIGTIVRIRNTANEELINKMKYQPDSNGVIYLDRLAFPVD